MNRQALPTHLTGCSNAATLTQLSIPTRSTSRERKEMNEANPNRDQMLLCRTYFQHLRKTLIDGITSIEDYKLTQPLDNLAVMTSEDMDPVDEARLNAKKRFVKGHIKEQTDWQKFHTNKDGPFSGKTLKDNWMQVNSIMSSPWMNGIRTRDILAHDDSEMFEDLHTMYTGALSYVVALLDKLDILLADGSFWTTRRDAGSAPYYAKESVETSRTPDLVEEDLETAHTPKIACRHSWPTIPLYDSDSMEEVGEDGQSAAQGTNRKRDYFARAWKHIRNSF